MDLVVGIDVSFRKGQRLPIVFGIDDGRRIDLLDRRDLPAEPPVGGGNRAVAEADPFDAANAVETFSQATVGLIATVADHLDVTPKRIGVDAPRRPALRGYRECEKAMQEKKISYIATPSDPVAIRQKAKAAANAGVPDTRLPEANRLWMLVGFSLFENLEKEFGPDSIIEVYPFAAFDRLGAAGINKKKEKGQRQRLEQLALLSGWTDTTALCRDIKRSTWGATDDKIDAFLCAVLAARARIQDAFNPGDPQDCIWMPPS